MFDLDAEVRRWRARQERRFSLSPREVDELEDHLRTRVNLELELDRTLTPARAFATVRDELGKTATLSREFVKAGRPRWLWLLLAGWILFGASFLLPSAIDPWPTPVPPGAQAPVPGAIPLPDHMPGWEAFGSALSGIGGLFAVLSAQSNILVLIISLGVLRKRASRARWTVPAMVGTTAFNSLYWLAWEDQELLVGYYAWVASFVCITVALWLRDRGWAPAIPERVSA